MWPWCECVAAFIEYGHEPAEQCIAELWDHVSNHVRCAKQGSGEPLPSIFDEMVVAVLHGIATKSYTAFVQTQYFVSYVHLRYATPPASKAKYTH